jgi:hypothetical protein
MKITTAFIALTAFAAAPQALAADFVVNSGSFFFTAGGPGTGRAQGIEVLSSFSLTALGVAANLPLDTYEVVIYASANGSTPGATLATFSSSLSGSGFDATQIATPFNFVAGNFYIVNYRPADGGFDGGTTFDYWGDVSLPATVGPIRLVDGIEGFNATNSSNIFHPSFRYRTGDVVVPAPAAVALFGLGAFAIGMVRRRG